jgi:protease-4
MKPRYVLIGVCIAFVVLLLFVVSLIFAKNLLSKKGTSFFGDSVGIVEIRGLITDSKDVIQHLHLFRDNPKIKAVVIRIDSPGGLVGPSQEIYEEVSKLVRKKPTVVSMGSVAASGGYYIAAPSSLIIANPGTITGSIGVLMKLSNIQGLLGKIGLNSFVLKSGEYKDTGSPLRPLTAQDKLLLQGVINSLHSQFVKAVASGRKIPLSEVKTLADGRIFSGEQALKLKLVDRLGNLQDAVEVAAKLSGIHGEPNVVYPPDSKKSFLDLFMEGTKESIKTYLGTDNEFSASYELTGN